MIYTYNETDIPFWDVVDKNEHFYRIKTKSSDIKNGFGIDIIKRATKFDDFFMDVLEEQVITKPDKMMWALGAMSFNLCYNNKTGMPFLKPDFAENEFAYDLFILTYKMDEGYKITNEKSSRFSVLYTENDTENQAIHIIAVARPMNNPFFYLTFSTDDGENYITKHLVTLKREGTVQVFINHMTKEEVDVSNYRSVIIGKKNIDHIKIAHTLAPYGLIIYPEDRKDVYDICAIKYRKNPKHTKYVNQNAVNLYKLLKECKSRDRYSAATFYVDKPYAEITEEDLTAVKYTNLFKRVNFLCSDGKMKSLN